MINKKRAVGISVALTLAVSAVMLVKTFLFSPAHEVKIKTAVKRDEAEVQKFTETVRHIPEEIETEEQNSENTAYSGININTADKAQLESLPGIGPSLADAIISHREEKGFFEHKKDIMDVSGIGEAKFRQISELISVGD